MMVWSLPCAIALSCLSFPLDFVPIQFFRAIWGNLRMPGGAGGFPTILSNEWFWVLPALLLWAVAGRSAEV